MCFNNVHLKQKLGLSASSRQLPATFRQSANVCVNLALQTSLHDHISRQYPEHSPALQHSFGKLHIMEVLRIVAGRLALSGDIKLQQAKQAGTITDMNLC